MTDCAPVTLPQTKLLRPGRSESCVAVHASTPSAGAKVQSGNQGETKRREMLGTMLELDTKMSERGGGDLMHRNRMIDGVGGEVDLSQLPMRRDEINRDEIRVINKVRMSGMVAGWA